MQMFSDAEGRQWELSATVGSVSRVRDLVEVDLCDLPVDTGLVQRLQCDDVLFVNALFAMLKPQADRNGVSDVDFGESFNGDVIDKAEEAFWAEMLSFFRGHRRRVLEMALTEIKERVNRRLEIITQAAPEIQQRAIEEDNRKLQELLGTLAPETPGEPSGSSQESSA